MDSAGNLCSHTRVPVQSGETDLRDWDARLWRITLHRAIQALRISEPLDALALSGNGPTLVFSDEQGHPVGPSLLWLDERTEPREGQPSMFLPKVAWMRTHRPQVYEQARWVFSGPEYLYFVLGGDPVTISPSDDFTRYIWTRTSIDAYGLDAGKFAPVVRPGARIGEVSDSAAREFGLTSGIPLVAGGHDFLMSLLGTATTRPGRTCDRAGTSEGINHCSVAGGAGSQLRTLPHVIPGLYNVASILSSTGRIFEWFRRISGQAQRAYDEMIREIAEVFEEDDRPYFFPSAHEGGLWEFSRGMFSNLSAHHDSRYLGRAVVESIGFAVREGLGVLAAEGFTTDELVVCGGQAKNAQWNQIKADMCGVQLVIPEIVDAELAGNAACCALAMGDAENLSDAADSIVRYGRRVSPETSRSDHWQACYEQYISVYHDFRHALSSSLE